MGCYLCVPTCDNCKPKFFECPQCGNRAFFALKECQSCGHVLTQDDCDTGLKAWEAEHASKNKNCG